VFVDEVLAELDAMTKDGARPLRSGPKLAGAALRKAVMAIWCVCFCGVQWRGIGRLCDISPSARFMGSSLAGPGSASGASCLTGCAATGGAPAGILRSQAPWSSMSILQLGAQLL
jgi:hypothetical protein